MIEGNFTRRHRLIPAITPILVTIVAVMSTLVLFGWMNDIAVFKSLLHGGRVAMNPVTAISFLLMAVSVWVLRKRPPRTLVKRCIGWACATLVLIATLGRIGAYAGLWNYRIDVLLFASQLHGNVMAPNTAMTFVLLSSAMLLLDARSLRGFHPAQPLVFAAASIAVLSLVGYLYDMAELYGVGGAIPMSLNAAIQFLLLSIAIVCSRPEREPLATIASATMGGVVARWLLPAAFLIPLLLGGLMLAGLKHDLFDSPFGLTAFVLVIMIVFHCLILWSARVIRMSDAGRKKADDELRLSEQRYHAVMRQTGEGIYLVDLDTFRIVEMNIALEKLLGYGDGELNGRHVAELIVDTPGHVIARLQSLKETRRPLQGERQYRRKDDSIIDFYASASVISYGDRSMACTVLHDVTERNRAVRLLQEKHDQLERAVAAEREALDQLREAQSRLVQSEKLASLGQMVAGVAHEINNPLSFVSNNVAVLQRDAKGLCDLLALYAQADETLKASNPQLMEEIHDLAERMDLAYTQSNLTSMMARSREGLRRIQQIVKDLRDFARLDESDLHEVDLNNGIESTVNIVAGRAKKKRVELVMDLKPLPLVTCYPAKINQVVMNLVANAIDASPEGGRVRVQTSREGDGVKIVVADNGTGVPPEIRDRIFDPFFTTKPQGEGTGLGLSISYGIIHDHGGQIEVTDAPGGGAMFTVTLPLAPVPAAEAR